jgi:hypothetical protein
MMPRAHSWHVPPGMRPALPGQEPRVDPMARLAVPVSVASNQPAGAAGTRNAPAAGTARGSRGRPPH